MKMLVKHLIFKACRKKIRHIPSSDAFLHIMHLPYLLQNFFVPLSSFLVKKPAPFVEVADCGLYVRREHFPALVAFGGVVVDYLRVGQEHGLAHFVQTADQVEVLEIHEKTVVKEDAVLRNRGQPHEHEAPRKARRVHRPVVPRIHEAVAGVLPLLPFLQEADGRDEAAENEVGRSGEQLAQVLRLAVRIDDFRQDVHRVGIFIHESPKRREHVRLEAYVGVQDDVVFRPHLDREAHRKVVRAAVAEVLVVYVADFFRAILKLPPAVVGRVVNDDELPRT